MSVAKIWLICELHCVQMDIVQLSLTVREHMERILYMQCV